MNAHHHCPASPCVARATVPGRWLLCALALMGALSLQAQPLPAAGKVMFVTGNASRHADGTAAQPIERDAEVRQGDQLATGSDGHVYIRMADGALLVLRPGSTLRIDHWQYNSDRPEQSQIKYSLQQGVSRYVSGKGSQAAKERFRFNTPMVAIGVRGTDFTVLARPDLTQVAVRSGGVVVSPFEGSCAREAVGPCEGRFAAELFASAGASFLQLRTGEQRPQLVRPNGNQGPEQAAPALGNEPTARNGKSNAPESAEIASVAESRTAKLASALAKEQVMATWGRWGQLSADEAAAYMRNLLQDRQLVAISPDHVLARNPSVIMQLPESGVGSFKLTEHEGMYRDAPGAAPQSTQATGGRLQIDFGQRRYQTELHLDFRGQSLKMQSNGTVEAGNLLESSVLNPATSVRGIVGGPGAGQAAYLYRSSLPNGAEISGATTWGR